MIDQFGRNIDYLRVSVTDRCNLRCRYCTPYETRHLDHEKILRYEEILKIAEIAVSLGITNFKITGGEPLVRKDCPDFISDLKSLNGTKKVTMTTNGLLLENNFDSLIKAGIDGINISLDTLNKNNYCTITGCSPDKFTDFAKLIKTCQKAGIKVKTNSVFIDQSDDEIFELVSIAEKSQVDVRFIELMPVGAGSKLESKKFETLIKSVKKFFPDLTYDRHYKSLGPAKYYRSRYLKGRIGFISALSQGFCASCNRIRLTGTGMLKPCLCYEIASDLRTPLRNGLSEEEIKQIMINTVYAKPRSHCFLFPDKITERHLMSKIGG